MERKYAKAILIGIYLQPFLSRNGGIITKEALTLAYIWAKAIIDYIDGLNDD